MDELSDHHSDKPEVPDAEWWRGAVIYQIYPRSFLDSNGDGIGDLPGITQQLGYVADLGVDGIWISPFFTSPMKDYGYDVANYLDVDPMFGTLADFDTLLETAHRLGLKVIIDQVYAHTSDEHDWFRQSRQSREGAKADWYVWEDAKADGTPPNNWQAVFGGPCWTWDARRQQYYMHNFLSAQPQLNVHEPAVQDALLDTARFWLDRGVDGFRLDALNFSMHDRQLTDNPARPPEGRVITRPYDLQYHLHNQSQPEILPFLERLRGVVDEYGARLTMAEIAKPDPLSDMRAYTEGDKRLSTAYSFDFLYAKDMTPERVKAAQGNWLAGNEGWPSWAFSNHDAPRCISRWHDGSDPAAYAKLTNALLLCLRGNPVLYQGEELGLPQAEVPFESLKDPEAIANWPLTLGRDGARTPMPWAAQSKRVGFTSADPWLPISEDHAARAVDRQQADEASVLAFTRQALAMRAASTALRLGDIEFLDAPDGLLVFVRSSRSERVMCLFNLTAKAAPYALPDTGAVLLSNNWPQAGQGDVPAYSVLVLAVGWTG